MKKSFVLAAAAVVLMTSSVFATDLGGYNYPTKDAKAAFVEPNGTDQHSYWLLQGFDIENYNPDTDPGLANIVDNEITKINNFSQYRDTDGRYAVVGHSQGGPRALAYATRLKKDATPAQYQQLKAVITISGVDRGIKALEGGFGPIKSKLTTDVDIALKGVYGAYTAIAIAPLRALLGAAAGNSIVGSLLSYGSYASVSDTTVTSIVADVVTYFTQNSNKGIVKYVSRAWQGASEDKIQQLYDMTPDSDFINENVCETKKKTVKKQVGTTTKYSYYWKRYGFLGLLKSCDLVGTSVPVYKTYTVSESDVAKFDADMPVGYIVGTDSSTLNLGFNKPEIDYDAKYATDTDQGGKTAKVVTNLVGTGMKVTEGLNIAKAVLTYNAANGALYASSATKCRNAADFWYNIEDYLNDVKGSSANDGFVAVESQYIPKSAHTKLIGTTPTNSNYLPVAQNHWYTEPVCYGSPIDTDINKRIPLQWDFQKGPHGYHNTNSDVMNMISKAELIR